MIKYFETKYAHEGHRTCDRGTKFAATIVGPVGVGLGAVM